jgi:hypothetical protein
MIEIRAIVEEPGPERMLKSVAELEQTLSDAASQAQAARLLNVVFLHAPNGDQLSLVVGGDETVLGFNHGHGNPPYYASAGQATADEPVLTAYAGLVHHTEFPRRWVVPMSTGRLAATEFLATGTRPTSVEWVAV